MKLLQEKSILFLLIPLLFGCSDNKTNETLDLDQIRPKSEISTKKENNLIVDSCDSLLLEYQHDSIDLKLKKLSIHNNVTFLSRFPSKKKGSRTLVRMDTTLQIQHEFYEYLDSSQMKNAFFNWLDCNGKNCKSIKLFEETKIEPDYLLVITSSNSIDIFRSTTKIEPEEWIDYVRHVKKMKDFKYILFQKKNQKVKWFEYKANKLIPKSK